MDTWYEISGSGTNSTVMINLNELRTVSLDEVGNRIVFYYKNCRDPFPITVSNSAVVYENICNSMRELGEE